MATGTLLRDGAMDAINFKTQIVGLNQFLTAVYNKETRISTLLTQLGFEDKQIAALRDHHLESIVSDFLGVIQARLDDASDDAPLFPILNRRYGLDGSPPDGVETVAEEFGLSDEDVRGLEDQAIQQCSQPRTRQYFLTRLKQIAASHLGLVNKNTPAGRIMAKLDTLAELRAALDSTRADYEAKREEVLKAVQAELDALKGEYEPILEAATGQIAQLEAEIKNDVVTHGASVQHRSIRAVYSRGRVTWDSKGIAQYAESHPDLLQFRKQGRPIVSLREVK